MISKRQKEQYVLDKYSVFFDLECHAYRRRKQDTPHKQYELGVISEYLTGDNILTQGDLYISHYTDILPTEEKELKICICGCDKCTKLFKMTHRITGDSFLVGSLCIGKAKGHEHFAQDILCAERNGQCKWCDVPLRFKGTRKNADKIHLRKQTFCLKCMVSNTQVYLDIDQKTQYKYKNKYPIKYDCNCKLWYYKGPLCEFPVDLVSLIKPNFVPPRLAFLQDDD